MQRVLPGGVATIDEDQALTAIDNEYVAVWPLDE
jgi:hypothetical protein